MHEKGTHRDFQEETSHLLDSLAQGKEEAISSLFDAYAKSLWFYCRAILRDEALAEDVVQEVFVRLWERRKRFPDLPSVRAFLYKVGHNLSVDFLKQRRIQQRHAPAVSRELSEDFLGEKLIEEELLGDLHRAIERLPAECARVFKLSLTGISNQEIADQLSLSIHTVKTQKQRALVALRERLRPPGGKTPR
ncbi:MAG: RNA polymerase sigma-70 factor [Odoribacteraceae bacterium]|jgi:RNA polymerase sigma-70 factor (ECF subfamily)|nr:RNA polymerase sigma-70 factor [Odoribacteraceae bacterium]